MTRRSSQSRLPVLAFVLGVTCLLGPACAKGDLWTNAAGNAVEATLISINGENVVFKSADGKRFTMPLASLSPPARQQALSMAGRIVVPENLRTDFGLCVNTLKRLGELQKAGQLGDDAYSDQRNAALERLKKAFQRWNVPEDSRDQLLMLARNH